MCKHTGLGSSAFARRYWRNHYCFLFLQVLRWFTSLGCLPRSYEFRPGSLRMNEGGLPHSEIPGSKPVCGSPELIAAYHVLHRHLAPRHSPYALSSLTIKKRTNADWLWTFVQSLAASVLLGTLQCVWSEKLPFAGYSVVKEPLARRQTGGEYRARTGDLLVANQALSQLS